MRKFYIFLKLKKKHMHITIILYQIKLICLLCNNELYKTVKQNNQNKGQEPVIHVFC